MTSSSLPDSFSPRLLHQLELLRMHSRRSFLGSRQGGHVSPKRGHGIEFSDYRQYELGDNPRHIDWGVYARTDRLYVKRFQEEQDLQLLLIIDTSASMFTPTTEYKWERARDICLALAYVALMQQDSVSVAALGRFHSPKLYGGRAIYSLSSLLAKIKPTPSFNFAREVSRAASRVRFPGIALIISDFLMDLLAVREALRALRSKNLEIAAVQVLSEEDLNPLSNIEGAVAQDSESGTEMLVSLSSEEREQYQKLLTQHNEKLKNLFADNQTTYASSISSQDFEVFISQSLPNLGVFKGY